MIQIDELGIGHDNIEVWSADTDRFFKAKIPFFFSILQEVGATHSMAVGCGIPQLMEKEHKTWVIVRAHIEVDRLPDWMETLHVDTWPEEPYRMFAPRMVEATGKDGSNVFTAISHWVVIDMDRKRPIRPTEALAYFKIPDKSQKYLDPDIGRLRIADDFKGFRLPDFKPVMNYYDTDTNSHINNISYVNWACDAFPFSFHDSHRIKMFDCHWVKQTFDGDDVTVETYSDHDDPLNEDEPTFFTRIVRKEEDGSLSSVFEAETKWTRR